MVGQVDPTAPVDPVEDVRVALVQPAHLGRGRRLVDRPGSRHHRPNVGMDLSLLRLLQLGEAQGFSAAGTQFPVDDGFEPPPAVPYP